MPLGMENEQMIKAAQIARVKHLTKRAEMGVCGRPDGYILVHAGALQFLTDFILDDENKELLLCLKCGRAPPNHLSHQAMGQYGMKHHLCCSRCNTEYSSWVKDGRVCMRL